MLKRNCGVQQARAGGPLVNVWMLPDGRVEEEEVAVTLPPLEFKLDGEATKGRITRILVEGGQLRLFHKDFDARTGLYGEFVET